MKANQRMTGKPATVPAVIKLVEGESAINKFLDSIKKRGNTLQRDMHVAACSVLAHVAAHKDIRIVSRLIDSFPDMSRRNAVKAWFEHFGPVTFESGKVTFNHDNPARVGDAMGKPFWTFKANEGAEYAPLNVAELLAKTVKALESDETRGKKAGVVVSHGLALSKLRALVAEFAPRETANAVVADIVETANAAEPAIVATESTLIPADTAPVSIAA
jgi:hypothetical protein